eukprot:gene11948-biopygen7898
MSAAWGFVRAGIKNSDALHDLPRSPGELPRSPGDLPRSPGDLPRSPGDLPLGGGVGYGNRALRALDRNVVIFSLGRDLIRGFPVWGRPELEARVVVKVVLGGETWDCAGVLGPVASPTPHPHRESCTGRTL